ncbi:MAG: hypothetical protein ACLSCO_17440 [Gallintestinimicrobium sp.]
MGEAAYSGEHFLERSALTEQLITLAPEVDIYIIPDVEAYKNLPQKSAAYSARRFRPPGATC